jgi:hypothetical protein
MTDNSPGNPGTDDEENVRAAARLRDQRPGWVVVWAPPLRRYSASPLFRAPRGTHLTAATPGELAALMDQAELAALMDQAEQAARPPRARTRRLDT